MAGVSFLRLLLAVGFATIALTVVLGEEELGKGELRKEELRKEELRKEELGKEELQKEELKKEELKKEELGKEELKKEELKKEELGKEELRKEELGKEELRKEDEVPIALEGHGPSHHSKKVKVAEVCKRVICDGQPTEGKCKAIPPSAMAETKEYGPKRDCCKAYACDHSDETTTFHFKMTYVKTQKPKPHHHRKHHKDKTSKSSKEHHTSKSRRHDHDSDDK